MGWREKTAGRFGRIEHDAGRIIALPIATTILFIIIESYKEALISAIITAIAWAVYLTSHTLEKKFYGPGLRR